MALFSASPTVAFLALQGSQAFQPNYSTRTLPQQQGYVSRSLALRHSSSIMVSLSDVVFPNKFHQRVHKADETKKIFWGLRHLQFVARVFHQYGRWTEENRPRHGVANGTFLPHPLLEDPLEQRQRPQQPKNDESQEILYQLFIILDLLPNLRAVDPTLL